MNDPSDHTVPVSADLTLQLPSVMVMDGIAARIVTVTGDERVVDAAQLQAAMASAQPAGDYMPLDISTLPALP